MASRYRNAPPAAADPVAVGKEEDLPHPDSPTMTSSSPRRAGEAPLGAPAAPLLDATEAKESVTVTVRFRPLRYNICIWSYKQWEDTYNACGKTYCNKFVLHSFTSVDVYTVENISYFLNTHLFYDQGDQISPGIIPLAVKDAFSIIQETPNREFLLRVSYLEIYNEVVNDLLNPSGQNLRVREDLQGTFVEGIKEEVVLSPAHALSLIAAGEEHRHVGSTNFNLLSSRSHTIFTLTIESSPCGESSEGEAVTFSQLNLIDLAGSESSRAETTGVRRKEGSYINKSLLTLGTVISKLTDGKATHVPFRDSKLTRLLQSSLSGQGRVSLICTVTPASSYSEETHNTLKFAHRAKHIEIQASQNKIMDEKSLIKKYQNEIRQLKEELDQLKRGILSGTPMKDATEDNVILWKQKVIGFNALHFCILLAFTLFVVLKELACLPYRRQDIILNGESNDLFVPMEGFDETLEVSSKEEKKNRKGILNWFKLRKHDGGSAAPPSSDGDQSRLRKAFTAPSTPLGNGLHFQTEQGMANSLLPENVSADLLSVDHEEFHSDGLRGEGTPLVSRKTTDHDDLLREQLKILSGEVALHTSVLKRLMEEAERSTMNGHIEMEMMKVNGDIKGKQQQIADLERQIKGNLDQLEHPLSHAELLEQLNEKAFELEVKTADNRIMQDQLQQKASECQKLQETVAHLKEQLSQALEANDLLSESIIFQQNTDISLQTGSQVHKENPASIDVTDELRQKAQQSEVDELKQRLCEFTEAKAQLEARNQKLLEESMYAKGLASAAGIELKALTGEVTKLMNHNERLASELASARKSTQRRVNNGQKVVRRDSYTKRHEPASRRDVHASYEREQALEVMLMEKDQREAELQKKIEESKQKEAFLEGELANMWVLVAKLKKGQGVDQDDMDSKLNGS
ncbi:Kinesin-like protein KIN-7D, chloroplastic [Dichanthelium oligosanthes]|uniref:Kinesin-like protein n=1 Tax=Dichanthelium oligosanthes TaxID=888268 RepID=A0A1E5WIF8_9POAL|nr:Kinesin-like protein KIN-7D, chloroplastic [Dichanthelium oligosanthes]